ncbi:MAG: 2-phospho-L-lactate transferase [Novosphingobium sp.]
MTRSIVVLTGGVGGAKLVLGLQSLVPPGQLTAIVNTGDDFRHLGLHISPDIDTLLYTLSGKANAVQGWGREGETWSFMSALRELGGEDWFALGDQDLALHVLRSMRLASGERLAAITRDFARHWGIGTEVLPMSEQSVLTHVRTEEGVLEFQRYFVERRCQPVVTGVEFRGAGDALPSPGVTAAIASADVIMIAPSNPFLSIDPMLAIPGLRQALAARRAPAVAVSPIVGGKAVKGPTAKLMAEMGLEANNAAIARHYDGLIDGLLVDTPDSAPAGLAIGRADIMMHGLEDKVRVARAALDLALALARG